MPEEILLYTFLKAVQSTADLKSLRLVCQRFKTIVEDPQIVKSLCDRAMEFNLPNAHVLWLLKQYGGNDISIILNLKPKDLKPLTELAARIKVLGGTLTSLDQSEEALTELHTAMVNLIKSCTRLEEFSLLIPNSVIRGPLIPELLENLPHTLQSIRVPATGHGMHTVRLMKLMMEHLPQLRSIQELTFDDDLTQDNMITMLESLLIKNGGSRYPNLEEISFGNLEMTPEVYELLHTHCPNLNPFPVNGSRMINGVHESFTDDEFIEIIKKYLKLSTYT